MRRAEAMSCAAVVMPTRTADAPLFRDRGEHFVREFADGLLSVVG